MSLQTCVDYLARKTQRVTFYSCPWSKRTNILDLIPINVCCMHSKTLRDAFYFVTFIDDYLRKVWATTLKSKN